MNHLADTCLEETVDSGELMTRLPFCRACQIYLNLLVEVKDDNEGRERLGLWLYQNCIRGMNNDN